MTDRLMTTREVAERLRISVETVLRWYHAGELPGVRLGAKVIRFRESEIETWIEQRSGDDQTD